MISGAGRAQRWECSQRDVQRRTVETQFCLLEMRMEFHLVTGERQPSFLHNSRHLFRIEIRDADGADPPSLHLSLHRLHTHTHTHTIHAPFIIRGIYFVSTVPTLFLLIFWVFPVISNGLPYCKKVYELKSQCWKLNHRVTVKNKATKAHMANNSIVSIYRVSFLSWDSLITQKQCIIWKKVLNKSCFVSRGKLNYAIVSRSSTSF